MSYIQNYPVLPSAIQQELTLNDFFAKNRAMRETLVSDLARGTMPAWHELAVNLSTKITPGKITQDFISGINSAHLKNPDRANAFLEKLERLTEVTANLFAKALYEIGHEMTSHSMREAIANVNVPAAANKPNSLLDKYAHEFFNSEVELRSKIILFLTGAQNPESSWKGVLTMLTTQPAFSNINPDELIYEIDSNHTTQAEASADFLDRFGQLSNSTLRAFVVALASTSNCFENLCETICKEAGAPEFYKELEFPGVSCKRPAAMQNLQHEPSPKSVHAHEIANVSHKVEQNPEEMAASRMLIQQLLEQNEAMKRRNEELLREQQKLRDDGKKDVKEDSSENDPTCIICWDRKVEHILLEPCRHAQFCITCAKVCKFCPTCMGPVTRAIPYFPK